MDRTAMGPRLGPFTMESPWALLQVGGGTQAVKSAGQHVLAANPKTYPFVTGGLGWA